MPIDKPLPLMVGNKAYYSLTSYDPVEISVDVPYTTDADVDMAIRMTVTELGGTPDDLANSAWIAEHFEGLSSVGELREAIRRELETMNMQMAENQKASKCVEALSARLVQAVPPQHIAEMRQVVQARFTQELQAEGMSPAQFLQRTGTTTLQLEQMFDRQAKELAEGDAALSAYAHEKKLKVEEGEIAQLLGIPPAEFPKVLEQVRANGEYDNMRESALRAKALHVAISECSCSYDHETPEHAQLRAAQYRQMQQMLGDDKPAEEPPASGPTGFKLV